MRVILLPPPTLAQTPTPDPRFGVVQTYDDFAAAAELNVGFTRVKLYWDVIQPTGADDWQPANIPDPLIEADLAAGREVIGLIVRTPTWARDLDHPRNDPLNPTPKDVPDMAAWANFTRKLATEYAGRIDRWVIWNEPDVWDANHPGSSWNGTVQDFARLHQTAYRSIKAGNPQAEVYLTGLTYFWDYEYRQPQYLARLLDALTADPSAAENDFYLDGVVYHLYYKPHMIYGMLTDIRTMLDAHGLADKAIWLNETNAAPSQDPREPPHFRELPFEVTLSEQAAFIIQLHALAFAADVERVLVYKLFNSVEHPEDVRPFGLIRGDGSRRPAFAAYQTVTTYLANFEEATLFQQADVSLVQFDHPTTTTLVLWNFSQTPRQVRVEARTEAAQLVNPSGQVETITPQAGRYTLDLPPAECSGGDCFIGGAPRLLIEAVPPLVSPMFTVASLTTPPSVDAPHPTTLEYLTASRRRLAAVGFALLVVGGVVSLGLWGAWRPLTSRPS